MRKDILRNYTDQFWNKRKLEEVEKVFHDQAVVHTTFGKYVGPHFMKATAQAWFKAFPDLQMIINDLIEEHEKIAMVWTAHGTHRDVFRGIAASNKLVNAKGVTIFRFEGNKIIEYWVYTDIEDLLKQIT
jgi:steroid delta-isomerase-like uncharacterized protein